MNNATVKLVTLKSIKIIAQDEFETSDMKNVAFIVKLRFPNRYNQMQHFKIRLDECEKSMEYFQYKKLCEKYFRFVKETFKNMNK